MKLVERQLYYINRKSSIIISNFYIVNRYSLLVTRQSLLVTCTPGTSHDSD